MFCLQCRLLNPEPPSPSGLRPGLAPKARKTTDSPPRCGRCGSSLLSRELSEQLLRKLDQLDQFGLTREGSPLLERRPGRGRNPPPTN